MIEFFRPLPLLQKDEISFTNGLYFAPVTKKFFGSTKVSVLVTLKGSQFTITDHGGVKLLDIDIDNIYNVSFLNNKIITISTMSGDKYMLSPNRGINALPPTLTQKNMLKSPALTQQNNQTLYKLGIQYVPSIFDWNFKFDGNFAFNTENLRLWGYIFQVLQRPMSVNQEFRYSKSYHQMRPIWDVNS